MKIKDPIFLKIMLLIVSSSKSINNESSAINSLFAEGLSLFHLRKPEASLEDLRFILEGVKHEFISNIVLHQEHQLADEFGIKRIHFKENERLKLTDDDYQRMKKDAFVYSTSVHSFDDYLKLNHVFEYAFYGPVFESISKVGYKPKEELKTFSVKNSKVRLIGIGGVTASNFNQVLKKEFDGVAFCGTIWESENLIETFKEILKCK